MFCHTGNAFHFRSAKNMNLFIILWALHERLVWASTDVPSTSFKRNSTVDYASMNLTCHILDENLPVHPHHHDRGSHTVCSSLCRKELMDCFAFGVEGRVCIGCISPLMSSGPLAPLPVDGLYERGLYSLHSPPCHLWNNNNNNNTNHVNAR